MEAGVPRLAGRAAEAPPVARVAGEAAGALVLGADAPELPGLAVGESQALAPAERPGRPVGPDVVQPGARRGRAAGWHGAGPDSGARLAQDPRPDMGPGPA